MERKQQNIPKNRSKACSFYCCKTQLVSFGWSNSTGATDVEMDRYFLEKKNYFMIFGLSFS